MNNNLKISVFFLVNANEKIGRGHLIRCKLIAEELSEKKVRSAFIFSNTDHASQKIVNKNFDFFHIKESESFDAFNISNILKKAGIKNSLLVIDSDNERYLDQIFQTNIIKEGIKLMIITVSPKPFYKSHILLNQNIIALYHNYRTEAYTKKLLGPDYFILDKKFRTQTLVPSKKSPPYKLFIAFGGADYYNITEKIINSIALISEMFSEVNIILGELNENIEKIKHKANVNKNLKINIHININDIERIMAGSEVAITSAGLTFWELSTFNIPSFMISASEREKEITDFLHVQKYCFKLGDYDDLKSEKETALNIKHVFEKGIYNEITVEKLRNKININGLQKLVQEMIDLLH